MKQHGIKKIILAYSGGLDTSIIIPWLKENYDNPEIIAVAGNVGQNDELEGLEEKALATGASKLIVADLVDEMVEDIIIPSLKITAAPTGEKAGTAQLDCDVAAVTVSGGTITSCLIDSLQAKVGFDAAGTVTSDVTAGAQTKNELGEAYGMKANAGSAYEWNEQAANFSAYVTGKAAAEVAGIAVDEKTAPTDADLAAGVTIAIGGFQALIAKALG